LAGHTGKRLCRAFSGRRGFRFGAEIQPLYLFGFTQSRAENRCALFLEVL